MIDLERVLLRPIEREDVEALYRFRNDWQVVRHLGGFSPGYSKSDLEDWVKRHANRTDEILWAIASRGNNQCIGHVGLYQIDYRVRKAEFAIVIGEQKEWAKGLGTEITRAVVAYGFSELNLHKVTLAVLANNSRAISIYRKLGFTEEGTLHDDQFRDGTYVDVILMAVFRSRWQAGS